jgi:RimJ/RimL family protein N-acetyltransferase
VNIDTEKLKGRHVCLQKLVPAHRELIRPLARDERIWEFTRRFTIDDTYDKQFDDYFDNSMDPNGRGVQQTFVIHETAGNTIIGMSRFYEYERTDKRLAIGYTWYVPSVWGKVYNKECKLLMLQYAFEEIGVCRVEFTVVNQNIRSQKAVEKIGAVREGVLRKHGFRPDGSPKDTVFFSIIDDEWPSVKMKLQKMSYSDQ